MATASASSPCTTRSRSRSRSIRPWSKPAARAVDVETPDRLTTGATIVDWRGQWGRLANAEVAVAVDAERFRRLFFEAMGRLADRPGRLV